MSIRPAGSMTRKTRAQRQFDIWAEGYDRSILQTLLFQPSYRALLTELWEFSKSRAQQILQVLDVGCGTGQFAGWVAQTTLKARVTGLDYAQNMLEKAQTRFQAQARENQANFIHADSEHLPFADGSIDFIGCANSFHHYPNQPQAVQEFRRVLRPGGRVALIDGFRDSLLGWFVFDVCVNYSEGGVHHVSHARTRDMFAQVGLRIIRQTKLNIWCPILLTVAEAPA